MNSSIFSSKDDRAKVQLGLLLGLFILMLIGVLVAFLNIPLSPRSQGNFLLGAIDNKHRLRNSKDGQRRILLVGGSSLGFSVSAKELSARLGTRTLNLGVHAGIGYRNIWRMYRKATNPQKDLIVLSPEYGILLKDRRVTKEFCDVIFLGKSKEELFDNIVCLPYIFNKTINDIIDTYRPYYKKKTTVYSRSAFNNYGDITSHLDLENTDFNLSTASNFRNLTSNNIVSYIDFVQKEIINEGYQVAVIPTVIPNTSCGKNAEGILTGIYKQLASLNTIKPNSKKVRAPVYCLSDHMFFDTAYHLNKRGRKIKTDIFAKYLQLVLDELDH